MHRKQFRELLGKSGLIVVPGVFDAVSAKLAEATGFGAVYVGSYGASASLLGVPDIGFVTRSEMVELVWRIGDSVDLPLVVDGESGFGNPIHASVAVRKLERAGAAAVQIEDHEFGKHLTRKPKVLPTDQAADKIRAAVDARQSEDLTIIARTDCYGRLGIEAATERAVAFVEAGADMLFVPGLPLKDIAKISAEVTAPIVSVDMPGVSVDEMAARGVKLAIFFALAQVAAYTAILSAFETLQRDGRAGAFAGRLSSWRELDTFLGIKELKECAEKYRLID